MNAFEELLVLLAKNDNKCITVGGFACAFNGYLRATEDVDVVIKSEESNVTKLLQVLSDYNEGYASELKVDDFTDEGNCLKQFPFLNTSSASAG